MNITLINPCESVLAISEVLDMESVLGIDIVLHNVSEFLEEEELHSFMIVSRKMYNKAKENTKIQIRILNIKLLFKQIELQRLRDDPDYYEKRRKQRKEQSKWRADLSTQSFFSAAAVPPTQRPKSFLLNSILFGNMSAVTSSSTLQLPANSNPKPQVNTAPKPSNRLKVELKDSIVPYYIVEFEAVNNMRTGLGNKISLQNTLNNINQDIEEYLNIISTNSSASALPKISARAFCPVLLAQSVISKVQNIIY